MSWHFIERWLQKVNQHSTLIGKFWITFLIVFRIVVVSSVGDRVYSDEQSEFKCNTLQIGCPNVCFNKFSPISHIRFWSFQIIMVTIPSIIFMVYSAHQIKKKPPAKEKVKTSVSVPMPSPSKKGEACYDRKMQEKMKKRGKMARQISVGAGNDVDRVKARQSVIQEMFGDDKAAFSQHYVLYSLSVVMRTGVEVLFIFLQYHLFGFRIAELYQCTGYPCPNVVDCFVSRPKEKTIFLWFMLIIAAICLALNIAEMYYLLWQFGIRRRKLERKRLRERRAMISNVNGLCLPDAEILDGGILNQPPPPSYGGAYNLADIDDIHLVPTNGGPGNPIVMSFSLDDDVLPDHLIPNKMFPGYNGEAPSRGGSSRSNNQGYPAPKEFTLTGEPYLINQSALANPQKEKGKNDYYDYI